MPRARTKPSPPARGRPRSSGKPLTIRLDDGERAAIRRRFPDAIPLTSAVRAIVREALAREIARELTRELA